jgi:N-acetylmuramoyl-L-alanine amidase CwlA
MKIIEMLAPAGSTVRKGKKIKNCVGVTIHNTDNVSPGAGAMNHAKYLRGDGKNRVPGWHYAVDDQIAACSIPDSEIAEHTGTREGNDTTLGIEICMNPDSDIRKATDNAAELTAVKLKGLGYEMAVSEENLFQHFHWSGKNCPSQIRRGIPYDWGTFVKKVNEHMKAAWTPPTFHISKILKRGMDDPEIMHITRNLTALGFMDRDCTSVFDNEVEAALRAFQQKYGLLADGVVGKKTTETLGGVWDEK